jgi:hypothetical protein
MNQPTCSGCGANIDPARAIYSKDGNLKCPFCLAKENIAEGGARASKSFLYSALGVALTGFFGIFYNPYFLFSLFAILGAFAVIRMLIQPGFRTSIGSAYPWAWAASVAGLVFALVQPAFWILAVFFKAFIMRYSPELR